MAGGAILVQVLFFRSKCENTQRAEIDDEKKNYLSHLLDSLISVTTHLGLQMIKMNCMMKRVDLQKWCKYQC